MTPPAATSVETLPAVDPEPSPDAPRFASGPRLNWNGRAWRQGLAASVLVIAAGLFCWTAQFLLPTARTTASDDFHGPMVVPWGIALVDTGVWILVPGAAALAFLLMMGARHYTRWSHWLRAVVLVLGLVAAALAWLALASTRLFVDQFYSQSQQSNDADFVIEWPYILNMSINPLILLALGILAALVVVRPNGRTSGAAALGAAAVLLVAGLLGTFSTQLFPATGQPDVIMQGDQQIQLQSWMQYWNQASPQLLTVAAAALLCAMAARVMAAKPPRGAFGNDPESEFAMDSNE
ncbi:hypothetical protein [Arthrobacter sp. E3]|uniref:hypothetical protein n=1 Tax=Arthrobacter sp. E3 TaxID=517402 RepID=UPI001A951467|nr:hypothetical protein [Arthrobacter sp. E3]